MTPAPVGEIPAIPWWVGRLYWLGVNLLLSATLLAVAPAFSEGVAATAREEALESGDVGLLAGVGTPIALVGLVPILGEIVGFVVLVLGLGAFMLAVHGWYTDREARRAERTA